MPERRVAAEETGLPLVLGGDLAAWECPSVPGGTTPIIGTSGKDVMIFGMICKVAPTGCNDVGMGVCRYLKSSSLATPCARGSFVARATWPAGTDPMRIKGDPDGGPYQEDVICAADYEGGGFAVPCGTNFYVYMPERIPGNLEICGDDCSVSYGEGDWIYGSPFRDTIFAGRGDDVLFGRDGSDCIWGDDGIDEIWGGDCALSEMEWIVGGNDSDWLYAASRMGEWDAGAACPRYIVGGAGTEREIYGGPGPDQIDAGAGGLASAMEWINGWSGSDIIHGGPGYENIHGGAGNDFLYGDGNGAALNGGTGNDFLDAGGGLGDWCYGASDGDPPDTDTCLPAPSCEFFRHCEL